MRLDRELGIYPGGELSEAYMRVLRQDIQQGSWEGGAARLAGAAPPLCSVVPRQLPAPPRGFTGRAAPSCGVLSGLHRTRRRGIQATWSCAAVTGMAGVGKTALAVH